MYVRFVVDITYDAAKNARNIAQRGLSFDLVSKFDFTSAMVYADGVRDQPAQGQYTGGKGI